MAAAALLMAAAGGTAAVLRDRPAPDAQLLIGVPGSQERTLVTDVAIRASDLDASTPLEVGRLNSGARWRQFIQRADAPRPGTDEWAATAPDSTGSHIELRSADGVAAPLKFSHGDDLPMSFSPDGMQLLILTTRWRTGGATDLAIVGVRSRSIRRLVHVGHDSVVTNGIWSPDGSRVAFIREPPDRSAGQLCVITIDGSVLRCDPASDGAGLVLLGWADGHRVVAQAGAYQCVTIDVDSREQKVLPISGIANARLDPSGQFLLITRVDRGNHTSESIVSVDRPTRTRQIVLRDSTASPAIVWGPALRPERYIDRLAIRTPNEPIPVRVPYQLTARAWAADSAPVDLTTVEWRSLTPARASIDSLGVLVARDTGTVVVEASAGGMAGGYRHHQRGVRRPTTVVLDEGWSGDVTSRWRFYGRPFPVIVSTAKGGAAFLNNGNGTFFSGAYYKNTFDARRGLSVDADLSVPVTETKWQLIQLLLATHRDTAALSAWDHRTGYNPGLMHGLGCSFSYPTHEGPSAALSASPFGSWVDATGDSTFHPGTGSWFHVRVQIFPDGRCGIALNGKPIFIGPRQPMADPAVTVALQGSSVDTRVLVGRLRVVQGVPDDMDWSGLRGAGGEWRAEPVRRWPSYRRAEHSDAAGTRAVGADLAIGQRKR